MPPGVVSSSNKNPNELATDFAVRGSMIRDSRSQLCTSMRYPDAEMYCGTISTGVQDYWSTGALRVGYYLLQYVVRTVHLTHFACFVFYVRYRIQYDSLQ